METGGNHTSLPGQASERRGLMQPEYDVTLPAKLAACVLIDIQFHSSRVDGKYYEK